MSTFGYILIGLLVLLALLLLISGILLLSFNTSAKTHRQLNRLAKYEYRQTRGSAHKKLIRNAAAKIQEQIKECQLQIDKTIEKKDRVVRKRNAELESAIHLWLVENRLQEVNGIGEALKSRILHVVFSSRISDLR